MLMLPDYKYVVIIMLYLYLAYSKLTYLTWQNNNLKHTSRFKERSLSVLPDLQVNADI